MDITPDKKLIAVGDDFGQIKVYRCPALKSSQKCVRLSGHSSMVPKVRYYNSDPECKYLISAGGMDRTYIQWRQVKAIKDDHDDEK